MHDSDGKKTQQKDIAEQQDTHSQEAINSGATSITDQTTKSHTARTNNTTPTNRGHTTNTRTMKKPTHQR